MSIMQLQQIDIKEFTNGVMSIFSEYMEYLLNQFGLIPLSHYIYTFSFLNVIIILLKCIPTCFYLCKFIKYLYITSRERIKQKQMELEDIKLQIRVLETKLSLRESECAERELLLNRKLDEFRKVRARVRDVINADEELRYTVMSKNMAWEEEINFNNATEEESKLILDLLKELKYDQSLEIENWRDKINCDQDCGEPAPEDREYLPLNDTEGRQDYHCKIVKVTNVYKVAYLRHYIKQRRIRRANKQALKKKMDSIKNLLDDWHRTLNMVINSKLSLLNFDMQNNMELASEEAMGDQSKPFYNISDSDSDFRNSADNCHDDYNMSWTQNQCRPSYNEDDFSTEPGVAGSFCDVGECCDVYDNQIENFECNRSGVLFMVPEETKSQVEIEKSSNDND